MLNTKRSEIIVWPSTMCVDGNNLWIYHGKLNALFKYNLETNDNAEHICSFQDEMLIRESAVSSLICTDKSIYSIPQWGNHIHLYNFSDKTENIIHIPDENNFTDKMLFSGAFLLDGKIYCIPKQYSYILSVDMETNEVNIEFDIKKYLFDKGNSDFLINDSCMGENRVIYAAISCTNRILVYDIKSKMVNDISIGEESNRLNSVTIDGENLYISDFNNKILIEYNTTLKEVVGQYTIPFYSYFVRKIAKGKVMVDSVIDENYMVLDESNLYSYKSNHRKDKSDLMYSYCIGSVAMMHSGKFLYYDRCAYKLRRIDVNGNIEENGKTIWGTIDNSKISFTIDAPVIENSALGLKWLMDIL